jgi:hypothetical protein
MAKRKGGAASAPEAATAAQNFVNTLKTNARVNEFKKAGIEVFNEKGLMRDPTEIIMESIEKRGSDPVGLKKLFANVRGAKPVEALASTYRQAGGGEAGMAAVRKELASFVDKAFVSS